VRASNKNEIPSCTVEVRIENHLCANLARTPSPDVKPSGNSFR